MRKLLYKSATGIGLALLSPAALAATLEDEQATIFGQMQMGAMYAFIAFVIIVVAGVYFTRLRRRQAPDFIEQNIRGR